MIEYEIYINKRIAAENDSINLDKNDQDGRLDNDAYCNQIENDCALDW